MKLCNSHCFGNYSILSRPALHTSCLATKLLINGIVRDWLRLTTHGTNLQGICAKLEALQFSSQTNSNKCVFSSVPLRMCFVAFTETTARLTELPVEVSRPYSQWLPANSISELSQCTRTGEEATGVRELAVFDLRLEKCGFRLRTNPMYHYHVHVKTSTTHVPLKQVHVHVDYL